MKPKSLVTPAFLLIVFTCAPLVGATKALAGATENFNVDGVVGQGQRLAIGGTVKACQTSQIAACYRNIDPLGGCSKHQNQIDFLCLQPGTTTFEGFSEDSRSAMHEGQTQFGGVAQCRDETIVVPSGQLKSAKQNVGAEIEDCISNAPLTGSCIVSGDETS
jgi:hypothetical protein